MSKNSSVGLVLNGILILVKIGDVGIKAVEFNDFLVINLQPHVSFEPAVFPIVVIEVHTEAHMSLAWEIETVPIIK